VHHLDGSFALGSLTAIAGPNGAGKIDLLKALMGELAAGLRNDRSAAWRLRFRLFAAGGEIDRRFRSPFADTVLLGAWRETVAFGRSPPRRPTRRGTRSQRSGSKGFRTPPDRNALGGSFQRVLCARFLLQDAKILLLDEPFTAIDSRMRRLLELIRLA